MSLETVGGNCPTIQQLPIGSLKHHGHNPYGESMFRVVWSESRYYMVGACHTEYNGDPSPDRVVKAREKDPNVSRRTVGYKWLPLYPGKPRWVLEMWKSPIAFTGCTKEQYNIRYRDPITLLLTLGPYPERGEYCECQSRNWIGLGPGKDEVDLTINLIKAGWNHSYKEHENANKEMLKKREKDTYNQFKDRFQDARPAFGNRPASINPGRKSQNDIKMTESADDLNLNRRNGLIVGNPHTPVRSQV
jgi:hypothetical protein